jgi:hypothetical protein
MLSIPMLTKHALDVGNAHGNYRDIDRGCDPEVFQALAGRGRRASRILARRKLRREEVIAEKEARGGI